MSRATRHVVRRQPVRLLAEGLYPALVTYLPAQVVHLFVAACGHAFRQRIYPPLIALWGMVSQALSDNQSDRATVYRLAAYFGLKASPRSGGYCAARQRMPLSVLRRATKHIADSAPQHRAAFPGRRALVVDGSNVTLADTPENQARYPQPKAQKPGCGFPVLHFVALLDLATGCLVDLVCGSLKTHESRLARPLWSRLKPGDILLSDRGFSAYGLLAALKERGIDAVMRQHHTRKNQLHLRGRLTDHWETWKRPRQLACRCPLLPASLRVRVISCVLPGGDRLILNTLLDDTRYSAKALRRLYRSRWQIETAFGDLKTTLRLDAVYPKRPRTAKQLLWTHALAYNLLCRLLLDVSIEYRIPRNRLSLKGAADALAAGLTLTVTAVIEACDWVMAYIARDLRPHRPDRIESRVLKRRPKQYTHMTQSRAALKLNPVRGKPK